MSALSRPCQYAHRNAITPNTIRTVEELRRQLKAVRETGVALVSQKYTLGIEGLAVPILSSGGTALGAMNVAIPVVRFNDDARIRIVKVLCDVLARIQRALVQLIGA